MLDITSGFRFFLAALGNLKAIRRLRNHLCCVSGSKHRFLARIVLRASLYLLPREKRLLQSPPAKRTDLELQGSSAQSDHSICSRCLDIRLPKLREDYGSPTVLVSVCLRPGCQKSQRTYNQTYLQLLRRRQQMTLC